MNRSLATPASPAARNRATPAPALQQHAAWRPALVLGAASLLLLGLAYALATTGASRLLFPAQADGSLLVRDGQVRGSRLIAQPFTGEGYFQARPSAANYDPMAAAGSNLARSNPALQQRVQASIATVAAREGVLPAQVPGDLVTQSGAGMDPELSPAAAQLQIARVARSRGLPAARVAALVQAHTLGPQWGVFGQRRVNVMTLNLALDDLKAAP
ncbi:potassium-transporting ATPase subunit KdpC [Stenotrophomonas rhizophila]|uniref:potassium-transporting ATPase subunit KdpC n=1 Tax=Stenotrophomonas rhizophila TaxID=216778 RepID=UPI001E2C08D3|nr:potassium-transporting ATPase subunit KdpC [Stenotrophomonas rhizophila]MCC7633002.1 potassium-transporting ATPase subunit KdpC [Stenotrophomonas rhizophila]MCC7661895.1 potassium-transporting ATPase subunit KdpC [Stenotrophomonas rhizophila]